MAPLLNETLEVFDDAPGLYECPQVSENAPSLILEWGHLWTSYSLILNFGICEGPQSTWTPPV